MGFCSPETCCGCINLSLGTVIIGILSMIEAACTYAVAMAEKGSGDESGLWIATWTVSHLVSFGICGLLIMGVVQRNPKYVTPFLVVTVLSNIFDLAVLGFASLCVAITGCLAAVLAEAKIAAEPVPGVEPGDAAEFVSGVFALVALFVVVGVAVKVHFLLVVAAFRDELRAEKRRAVAVAAPSGGRPVLVDA